MPNSMLQKGVHDQLIADLPRAARSANIHPSYIERPLAEHCSDEEVEWVKRFTYHSGEHSYGLILTETKVSTIVRVSAIAGALTRNFILARVATVNQLFDEVTKGLQHDESCLLIPNFHTSGAELSEWKIAAAHDVIFQRAVTGKQTVLGIASMKQLKANYGSEMHELLENNFYVS